MNIFLTVLVIVFGIVIFFRYHENPNGLVRMKCPKCGKRKGELVHSLEGKRYEKSNINYIDSHRTFKCQNPACRYTWDKTVPEKIG